MALSAQIALNLLPIVEPPRNPEQQQALMRTLQRSLPDLRSFALLAPAGFLPAPRIDAGYGAVIAAGLLVGFGTRYGSGCTSGHGISGALQLAVSGWTFFLTIFASAVAVSFAVYGKGARHAR